MKLGGRRRRGGGKGDRQAWLTRTAPFVAACVAAGVFVATAGLVGVLTAPPASAVTAPPYLLALGGSASVGYQPTPAHPHGQATSSGYAEDLVPLEQQRWPGLTVVHLGCPGATTVTVLERRREVPLRRGGSAPSGGSLPADTSDHGARHRRSRLQRPRRLPAPRGRRCLVRGRVARHRRTTSWRRSWPASKEQCQRGPASSGWVTTTRTSVTISEVPAGRPSRSPASA